MFHDGVLGQWDVSERWVVTHRGACRFDGAASALVVG